jgi:two-component system, NarL family, response regulator LiaR
MSHIRVLLADDLPVVRLGLRSILEQAVGIEVVGEAIDGDQAVTMTEELSPDVLILGMEMPNRDGFEAASKIQKKKLSVKILALSANDEKNYVQEVLSIGAVGYLLIDEEPDVIIEAIRGVARGEKGWFSREVGLRMAEMIRKEKEEEKITPRELEVLKLLVEGKTNLEIGLILEISEKTVEKHLESIYEKLDVSSRTEAAVYAVREKIVTE